MLKGGELRKLLGGASYCVAVMAVFVFKEIVWILLSPVGDQATPFEG